MPPTTFNPRLVVVGQKYTHPYYPGYVYRGAMVGEGYKERKGLVIVGQPSNHGDDRLGNIVEPPIRDGAPNVKRRPSMEWWSKFAPIQ